MSGIYIAASYLIMIACFGWWGVVAAALHIGVLLVAGSIKKPPRL